MSLRGVFRFLRSLLKHDYDNYVPYFYPKNSILSMLGWDRSSLLRRVRIRYWTKKAKRHAPFQPFYASDSEKLLSPLDVPDDLKEIYRHGTVILDEVLGHDELQKLSAVISEINLPPNNDVGFVQCALPDDLKEVREAILRKLRPIHEYYFDAKNFSLDEDEIDFSIRIDYAQDGEDASPATANWHCDRFIPTLNGIYFPFGADWGEFEKETGDPTISERDLEIFSAARRVYGTTPSEERDFMYQPTERSKVTYTVKENIMVLGSHHLQHRRSPIERPGMRPALFIDYYNYFHRKHLK